MVCSEVNTVRTFKSNDFILSMLIPSIDVLVLYILFILSSSPILCSLQPSHITAVVCYEIASHSLCSQDWSETGDVSTLDS